MKISYCLFDYMGVTGTTCRWIHLSLMHADRHGHLTRYIEITRDALITRSRSRIMTLFMDKTDSDVLVMIDHDMRTSRNDDFLNLCLNAVTRDAVVGCIYPKRAFKEGFVGNSPEGGPTPIGPGQPVIPMRHLGTGLLAISRTAGEKVRQCGQLPTVPDPYHNFEGWFRDDITDEAWVSEDYAFCNRCHEAGVPILADTSILVGHTGPFEFLPQHAVPE